MSRRATHVRAGLATTVAGIAGIAAAAHQGAALLLLDGATRASHVLAGVGMALACGYVGARLPDWIEPARTPHHRGFWHSKALGGALMLLACLLAQGSVWEEATPRAFLLRASSLFLVVGYLSHLVLDLFSKQGLPRY